ncbi:DODA-type extradiol aromatic ring-opening family dioxygenase [Microbulbifer sp. SA54]|uniref:DODA-type extradiol aromatic ring-opening family dioxygenase n=1 Tax=Microbulbifer sp. SA54 TaxID=3401577 RepID=UPI003AADA338
MAVASGTPEILFLSHGGGPLPLLGDPGHDEMVTCLQRIAGRLRKPSAVLVISAHWEEAVPTITSGATPPLIYDYYGFPEASYSIQYPCPGEPELARELQSVFHRAGIEAALDDARGFDHGVFVPMKILFPDAAIPCVQLSLTSNLNAAEHLAIGEALQGLAWDNLLVVGSGFSFHNMRAFFAPETAQTRELNGAFEQWLQETCTSTALSGKDRKDRLIHWEKAPGARFCHPREEHLLPLHVCCGLAGVRRPQAFVLNILNKRASMYLWQ